MTFTWREPVQDAWIDYNGHLSEPYYVLVFGNATTAVMDAVGIDPAYREATDSSLYTVEAHVRYLGEVSAGAELEVRTEVVGATGKLMWLWHELYVGGEGGDRLAATEEVLGVHVTAGSSSPFPEDVAATVRAAVVAAPEAASGQIRLRPAAS